MRSVTSAASETANTTQWASEVGLIPPMDGATS